MYLVSYEDDGDALTYPCEVLMPLRNILIGNTRSDVEHDDGTVGSNVVALPKTTQLLLPSSIPDNKTNGSMGGVEHN